MQINDILNESRAIWGNKKCGLSEIIVRMGKVLGDICRYARNEKITDRVSENDLKKELGNMIVSGTRWCDDLGFDPRDCVVLAVAAQKRFRAYEGETAILSTEVGDLLAMGRLIWGNEKCDLDQVVVRMGKVFGDICRYGRNAKPSDRQDGEAELKKEMGNMIFSTICWCNDLGYDPDDCIKIAFEAQKEYQK